MTKYELKKFPLLATIITLLGLLTAILAMSVSLMMGSDEGIAGLALLEVAATVLVLAGLTTGKVGLLRVISTIVTVCFLIVSFVLAVVKYNERDVFLFSVSLLMLAGSILSFVYFLTLKNPRIEKMYYVSSVTIIALVTIYIVIFAIQNFRWSILFLLVSYEMITALPVSIYISLTKVEQEEPKEEIEEPEQEVAEDK